uniref:Uncharacterized protein n=1 Tax=Romanomermis culicivorax TaxID=13658 RepID=A0A915J8G8_ROMCU
MSYKGCTRPSSIETYMLSNDRSANVSASEVHNPKPSDLSELAAATLLGNLSHLQSYLEDYSWLPGCVFWEIQYGTTPDANPARALTLCYLAEVMFMKGFISNRIRTKQEQRLSANAKYRMQKPNLPLKQ